MTKFKFPPWVVFHVPHDSTFIPHNIRSQFLLNSDELQREFVRMTDFWTLALYANGIPVEQTVVSPVSRLVVDVERFADDKLESMSKIGMGVIYTASHDLKTLRRNLSFHERRHLLETYYYPHHAALEAKVEASLNKYNKAVVVDLHSFSSQTLPYEGKLEKYRPEICIGTDSFHTSSELSDAFKDEFGSVFDTSLNTPFAGALVPMKYYNRDSRVSSVMVETRRDLYEDEEDAELLNGFVATSKALRNCLAKALSHC